MDRFEDRDKPCASLLLGIDVSRGFVVRSGKQGAKRGGMGAVRIRETYLRGDGLLVSMADTLLGEGGEEKTGSPRTEQAREGRKEMNGGGGGGTYYVCPTADFLHCYLELFERPSFVACFQRGGSRPETAAGAAAAPAAAGPSLGGGGEEGPAAGCNLLLLHSELSKLTGAAGALSMKQERHLAKLARVLPGTVVFFDKFCPDLHGAAGEGGAGGAALAGARPSDDAGDTDGAPPPPPPPSRPAAPSPTMVAAAACRWCSKELGNAPVVVLSEGESGGRVGNHGGGAGQAFPREPQVGQARAEEGGGGGGVAPRVLGLREFLRDFVGGQAEEELAVRGDLLRGVHLSAKAAMPSLSGASKDGRSAGPATSPLAAPHPSKTQLEALIAGGGALKGKLDVFEHNPREGVVIVGAGGAGGGAGALEGWTDVSGRTKVLVVGREGMNRSIHGDTVAVTLLPKTRWRAATDRKRLTHAAEEEEDATTPLSDEGSQQGEGGPGEGGRAPPGAMPTGFVVGVVEEGRRPYVVTIPPEETTGGGGGQGGSATVGTVPMDPRVPKIRIKTRQLAQISGQRLVVMVDGWDMGHMFPFGHYVTSLGPVGEVSSEAAALLVECEASFQPFSFNALASLPLVPNPPKESQRPRDALMPPATLAERERPEDGFGKAPRWQDSGWRVQEADVVGRRDLRAERAMSVDPPGCQDIDDAMHVTRKPDGKLEIGVHIADVTRFVGADGPLDREARARATTVYLVHRRIDMLPALLASDLCSLHAGEDRLSVSVVWQAEEDGEDIRLSKRADGSPVCWFGRTVIHSKASMTYDQAQMLVEDGRIARKKGHEEPPPGQAGQAVGAALQPGLAHDLRLLTRFARTARGERVRNGAIDLSQAGAELKFKIDPATGTPLAVAGKEDSEIHHTIAELMILANSAVAEQIERAFPSAALVRVHAAPDPSRLTTFEGVAAKVGVHRKGATEVKTGAGGGGAAEGLSASLAATAEGGVLQEDGAAGKSKAGLLKSLAVRAMSEAEYVSTGTLSQHQQTGGNGGKGLHEGAARFGHFGLGLSHYTHFTSPIRRYADIVVHRLLLASLGISPTAAAPDPRRQHPETPTQPPPPLPPSGDDAGGSDGDPLLPPSLAPSVMEMEEAAAGKGKGRSDTNGAERRSAGDASLVTNPDGTRTYSKVNVSATAASLPVAARADPPPGTGTEAFPGLARPASHDVDGIGDDVLDALLGLDVSGVSAAKTGGGGGGGGLEGFEAGNGAKKSFSEAVSLPAGGVGPGDEGDSMLDALLGLEVESAPSGVAMSAAAAAAATEGGIGGGGATLSGSDRQGKFGNDSRAALDIEGEAAFGSDADGFDAAGSVHMEPAAAPEEKTSASGSKRWGIGGAAEDGEVVPSDPPFEGAELGTLCTHLNDRNRRAKRLAQRCQEMFLRLFFKDHSQVVQGLVLSLRSNGFIAYVPAFDAKGPVYISDKEGQVQVDPALLGLSAGAGSPPSKGFAALPTCRAFSGASVLLVTEPAAATTARRRGGSAARGWGGTEEEEEEEEALEVRPPPGSGGKALRLRVLDGVSLRLSCEVLPTQARLPKVRFLLAGVGNTSGCTRPASSRSAEAAKTTNAAPTAAAGSTHHPGAPSSKGVRGGAAGTSPGGPAGAIGAESAGGLYWLLQGARDDAVCGQGYDRGRQAAAAGSFAPPSPATTKAAAAAELAAEIAARRREKKERNKNKDKDKDKGHPAGSSGANQAAQQRSEVGAGRALFGGFVPSRQAPAASLYDFGSGGGGGGSAAGGIGDHGTGATDGGGFADVSNLKSIYSQGGGRGVVPGGSGVGGSTLGTLDDARVRQYAQDATTRAQRLGAEKRNSRISKSKRQG